MKDVIFVLSNTIGFRVIGFRRSSIFFFFLLAEMVSEIEQDLILGTNHKFLFDGAT